MEAPAPPPPPPPSGDVVLVCLPGTYDPPGSAIFTLSREPTKVLPAQGKILKYVLDNRI